MALQKMHSVFVSDKQLINDDLSEVNEILDEGYWIKKMRETDDGIIFILLEYRKPNEIEA